MDILEKVYSTNGLVSVFPRDIGNEIWAKFNYIQLLYFFKNDAFKQGFPYVFHKCF